MRAKHRNRWVKLVVSAPDECTEESMMALQQRMLVGTARGAPSKAVLFELRHGRAEGDSHAKV